MMCDWKTLKIVYLSTLTILLSNSLTTASIQWDDNIVHTLDSSNHILDTVVLDSIIVNNPGTTANMIDGGYVSGSLIAWNNGKINMSGGTVGIDLRGYTNSEITISGGTISNNLQASGEAHINMSGGVVNDGAELFNNSTLNMTGGFIPEINPSANAIVTMSGGTTAHFQTNYSAIIFLDGTDFVVTDLDNNTTILSPGDKLSDYSTFVENGNTDWLGGSISGILADGSALDVPFQIFNMGDREGIADIIIIPEPATLSLLAIGAILLRRRRATVI